MDLTTTEQPELLQYTNPKGETTRFTNHTAESQLGHFAVYYAYVNDWWVYSGKTVDPSATVKAWTNAGVTLPKFFFAELTAVEELV